jgi:hypothetical protein
MIYKNKARYEGQWKNNRMHGNGVYVWEDGREYEGTWQEGFKSGEGTETHLTGERYEGQWCEGMKHGLGSYQWPTGKSRWGQWNSNRRQKWLTEEMFGKKPYFGNKPDVGPVLHGKLGDYALAVDDRVRINKRGTEFGKTALVVDPDCKGMVKVAMEAEKDENGKRLTVSYERKQIAKIPK